MSDKQSLFIEQLFNAISSDPTMPAELKVSLLTLQLPVHKLSLTDASVMTNTKHPARRTFFLAKRASSLSKNNRAILNKIIQTLSALNTQQPDAECFFQVNYSLEKLITHLQGQTSNGAPLNNTKERLSSLVKHCLQGYEIPTPCQNLVLKLWPNALFFILKNHGDHSPQLQSAIAIYCALLNSIQAITSASQQQKLKDSYMNIVRSNNNFLLLHHQEETVESEIKSLIAYFNHMLGLYETDSQTNTSADTPTVLPESVKPGVWCEIYMNDITPARRLRLSFINMDTGMLVFVNRKGIKKVEKNAAEFAAELKQGLSKIYKADALFTKPPSKTQFQKFG